MVTAALVYQTAFQVLLYFMLAAAVEVLQRMALAVMAVAVRVVVQELRAAQIPVAAAGVQALLVQQLAQTAAQA